MPREMLNSKTLFNVMLLLVDSEPPSFIPKRVSETLL